MRERARALGLATAEKPESQEICFVPDGDYASAVERVRPDALPGEGEIVDAAGRVVGRHAGIHHFTVGQRRGLGVAAEQRLYVTALDAARNRVVVGGERALEAPVARGLERVSWIAGAPPPAGTRAQVRVRHRTPAPRRGSSPRRRRRSSASTLRCARVAPGQAAVFYAGRRGARRRLDRGAAA